jgi:Ca-activated chloride channel family protein
MKFEQPYIFFLLLIPPLLLIVAVVFASRRSSIWSEFVASRLRTNLIRRSSPLPRWISFASLLLACAFIIIGLARFQITSQLEAETTKGRNIVIVLDLSRSMATNDLKPSRLAQAKALIYDLLETLPNDRIAVVGFAGSPFLFVPLTPDHDAVRSVIEELDFDSIATGGSVLADAVKLGIKTLKETAQTNNGMIILTDGEEHDAELLNSADDITKSNTYTFTIGIGTEQGGFIPDANRRDGKFRDSDGNIVVSRLKSATLENFATRTKGRFAEAASSTQIPAMVSTAVADLDSFERQGRKKMVVKELYSWFVLPAMILLFASILAGTRWRSLRPVTSLTGWIFFFTIAALSTTNSSAAESDADLAAARSALESKDYQKAIILFEQLAGKETPASEAHAGLMLGKATAHYRLKEYAKAREAYSRALETENSRIRANAHQGMVNCLFQLGWQTLTDASEYPGKESASKDFDAALQKHILEWMTDSEASPDTSSSGFLKLKSIMIDWADAVRHNQSAVALDPAAAASDNGEIARAYLKKLRQKIEEQQQQMQMQMQGQGESGEEPQEGEGGDGDQEGDGDGKGGAKQKDGKGKDKKEPKDGNGGTPKSKKPDPKNEYGKDRKNGETPQEHALRKLEENSDLQRGIVAPGESRQNDPEKNW